MKIALDSSALIESLCGLQLPRLMDIVASGHRLLLPAQTLYEWRRGPRKPSKLTMEQRLFPPERILPFTEREAIVAAQLFKTAARARARSADIAIAATSMTHDCLLWTFNRADFTDLPGLRLLD